MNYQIFKYSLVAVLLFISLESSGQFINDTKRWYNLHGKVRSCTETGYNLIKGDTTGKHINMFDSVVFNRKGQVTKAFNSNTVRGADINKRFCTEYKYDVKGDLLEQLYHNTNGITVAKCIYSYSTSKKMVVLKIYLLQEKDSSRVSDSYKIDASGRILERYHYNETFVPDVKYQYSKTVYKYDAKGLRVEVVSYDLNGEKKSRRLSKYNQNNEMEKTDFIWLPDQRANETLTYTYPGHDKYNNWLVRNRYIHGRLHSVNERTIIYYK